MKLRSKISPQKSQPNNKKNKNANSILPFNILIRILEDHLRKNVQKTFLVLRPNEKLVLQRNALLNLEYFFSILIK